MSSNKNSKIDTSSSSKPQFVFGAANYKLLVIGIVVVVLGFVLMYGKEDIYDFRKITLAPFVVIAGFVIAMVSIFVKPKDK